jgi:IclR family transcriptional regulator, acetate operon repressor
MANHPVAPIKQAKFGTEKPIRSVLTASEILECIAAAGGQLSLTQIVERSGVPLTTIHRMLQALAQHGYIRQDAESRLYSLGPRLIHLGGTSGRILGSWARPWLKRLVEATGESATLAVLDGLDIVFVAQVPSGHNLRMFTELGKHIPALGTAAGEAMLASLSNDAVERLFQSDFPRPAIVPPESEVAELLERLSGIRARGYALEDGERESGVRAFAMVVAGERPMAISVSGPSARMPFPVASEYIEVLKNVTAELANRPQN